MKIKLLCISSLILGSTLAPAKDFIRQIQLIGNSTVVVDLPVSGVKGEVTSKALTSDLSIFQLYATHTRADKSTELLKLDEVTVGTFLPEVTITTSSEDTHVPTTTRADRPYTVDIRVSGLLDGESVPDYARTIYLGRRYKLYSPEAYTPNGVQGDYEDVQLFQSNGTFTDSIVQRLPATKPKRAVGEETFTAYVHPDADPSAAELASGTVIVWPAGTATINGIYSGATYNGTPSNASITLEDAYPRSTTHAQIYKGPDALGTQGEVLEETVRTYGTGDNIPDVPQNTQIPLSDLGKYITEDGEYTIGVYTVTPFYNGAHERLAHVTFNVKRTIAVNSMLTTIE